MRSLVRHLSASSAHRRRLLAFVGSAALVVTLTGPAAAVPKPTPEQIAAQQREAAALKATARTQAQQVNAAKAELAGLADQASSALLTYQSAQNTAEAAVLQAETARQAEREAQAQLAAATQAAEASRTALSRFASAAYRGGYSAGVGQLAPLLNAESPAQFASRLELWGQAGDSQGRVLEDLKVAQAAMDQYAATAAAARAEVEASERTALEARDRAAAAKVQADALAGEQERVVAGLDALQRSTAGAAAASEAKAKTLQQQRNAALAAEAAAHAQDQAAGIPGVEDGCGNPYPDTRGGFRNGCIPLSSLSKISFYSYHYLRSDAAGAFNRMNAAFEAEFGAPISVTDSYRSYAQQVALKAAKPTLAATPGKSNHGWGVAVDLSSRINSFSSPQHQWMRANAPRFGWVLPGWAQETGSKPEPWHWEFAG